MPPAHFLPDEEGNNSRPPLIGVLGVLTMVNCIVFLVIYALGLVAMLFVRTLPMDRYQELLKLQMEQFAGLFPPEELAVMNDLAAVLHQQGALLIGLLMIRTTARLIGAVGMWNGRRSGFHIYAVAQLGGIFLPHIVLPLHHMGITGPMLAVAFTALYGTQLKRLI